jgi:AraC-like DNA-binding protein
MRRRAVGFVAWTPPIPTIAEAESRAISCDEILRRTDEPCSLYILSAVAIERVDPLSAVHAFAGRSSHVAVCADACFGPRLAQWIVAGFRQVIPSHELVAWLRGRLRAPPPQRPRLSPAGWILPPPSVDSDAFLAAAAVDDLARPTVHDWATSLQWSNARLRALCRGSFGASPRTLIRRYVLAASASMDAAGATREAQADALGYSSSAALCHALRRARCRWPDLVPPTDQSRARDSVIANNCGNGYGVRFG